MDWNPVIHLLDELSDGTQPFAVMRHMMSRYDRASLVQNLLFLANRDLIKLLESPEASEPIPKSEWQRLLRGAFETNNSDSGARINFWIDLTEEGEHVLRLFGIGRP
jgi:hypothetical protein